MLRDTIKEALKQAMLAKESAKVSTLRLILAAIKDRDIAARTRGVTDGIKEDELLQLLQSMIKQRRESIEMYEKGGRPELAAQEQAEIDVIASFLPKQLSDADMERAVKETLDALGITSIKDMGKAMAALREKYAGQMDFSKASVQIKKLLTGG